MDEGGTQKMKKTKRSIILCIIVILLLGLSLFRIKKQEDNKFQDELIFFKLFSSQQSKEKEIIQVENQQNQTYEFSVTYRNIDFKEINLMDTINPKTLIQEKIAPGTGGEFEILLHSNKKMNYRIKFKSKNQKPKNLNFKIQGKDRKYNQLEEMQEELKGEINGKKTLRIQWNWNYEKDETQDLQDTKDGEIIKEYNFTIYAIAE